MIRGLPTVPNTRRIRSFRDYTPLKLIEELCRIDWSGVLLSSDVDFSLSEFVRLFGLAVDAVAPGRDVRVRNRSNPWMSPHILSGIKLRDSLFSRYKRDRSISHFIRNTVEFVILCKEISEWPRRLFFGPRSQRIVMIRTNYGAN